MWKIQLILCGMLAKGKSFRYNANTLKKAFLLSWAVSGPHQSCEVLSQMIFQYFIFQITEFIKEGGMDIVVLLVVLFIAALTDYHYEKVPNLLILCGILAGIVYRLLTGAFAPAEMLLGIFVPVLLFWPLFLVHAMGAGDIKLMSVMGVFLGWRNMLFCVTAAIILAAVAGLIKGLRNGIMKERFTYLLRYLKQVFLYCSVRGSEFPEYQTGTEPCAGKVHFAIALFVGSLIVTGGFL